MHTDARTHSLTLVSSKGGCHKTLALTSMPLTPCTCRDAQTSHARLHTSHTPLTCQDAHSSHASMQSHNQIEKSPSQQHNVTLMTGYTLPKRALTRTEPWNMLKHATRAGNRFRHQKEIPVTHTNIQYIHYSTLVKIHCSGLPGQYSYQSASNLNVTCS